MTARRGLGDLFNLATSATTAKTRVNMQNATGVTFVCIGATSGAVTINECNAASAGTEQALTATGDWWTQASGVWTKGSGTPTAATGGLLAIYVSAVSMSDGFSYLDASHSAGSFVYILHGLESRRDPANLKAVTS